jgi:hypothetical protein
VLPPKGGGDGFYFYGEFATGKANIKSFDIGFASEQPFALAGMTFDTAGAFHKPDFRLSTSDALSRIVPGEESWIELTVARLYGSTGPINLAISSTPEGLFAASPTPPPIVAGDGEKVRLVLIASRLGKPDDVITVTGTPAFASVGTGKRAVNVPYTPFGPLP